MVNDELGKAACLPSRRSPCQGPPYTIADRICQGLGYQLRDSGLPPPPPPPPPSKSRLFGLEVQVSRNLSGQTPAFSNDCMKNEWFWLSNGEMMEAHTKLPVLFKLLNANYGTWATDLTVVQNELIFQQAKPFEYRGKIQAPSSWPC